MRSVLSYLESLRPHLDPMVPMTVVAAFIGVTGAIVVEGFRRAMYGIVMLYSGREHLVAAAMDLPGWVRVLIPTMGATIGGLIMWTTARWVHRPRGPEYMEAILVGDGTLPLLPNLARTVSSLAGVSAGITIGREGTMIQIAAVTASALGRIGPTDPALRRLIVASGAAAGFASAYHAPIAGTLFVSEIILGGLALREITAILVAAVLGELTTQGLFASGPLYLDHAIPAVGFADLTDAALIGLIGGLAGPAMLRLFDESRRHYQKLVAFLPLRMGLVGLFTGLLATIRPEVFGNGYSVVQSMLSDPWPLSSLALVSVLRLASVTAASAGGIPGGVLTPTLMLGGAMGLLVQQTLLFQGASHTQDLWVLVGMGSLLAATTHAPAMSAVMMFEITRDYNVVLATMPACVMASVLGTLLHKRSVYAEALGVREGPPLRLGEAGSAINPAGDVRENDH